MKNVRLICTLVSMFFALISCAVDETVGSKNESGDKNEPGNENVETPPVESTLELPSVLSDHMVLQQNSSVCFWGKNTPGAVVTVRPSWTDNKFSATTSADGLWEVMVSTPAASFSPYNITIEDNGGGSIKLNDVLTGEVWMCAGQSNMEHPMRGFGSVEKGDFQPVHNAEAELADANISHFRYFKDKYQLSQTPMFDTKKGDWAVCTPVAAREYEAIAFFFGRHIARSQNVPVGIIGCAYGGTRIESWMSPESISKFNASEYKDAAEVGGAEHKSAPSNIYNGMVLPVLKYGIRGWLWYQGESNRDNYNAYARLMQEMVRSWREVKGDVNASIPFYYVQIAPFTASDNMSGAYLRDAQLEALKLIPNSGIVCAGDVGDPDNIHYPRKQEPAARLAMWAERYVYGNTAIEPMAPTYSSMTVSGNVAAITLENAAGLHLKETDSEFCQIAGANGIFYKASVQIEDGKMLFSAPEVTSPVAVRYCYSTWHVSSCFNGAGLPVFPFEARLENDETSVPKEGVGAVYNDEGVIFWQNPDNPKEFKVVHKSAGVGLPWSTALTTTGVTGDGYSAKEANELIRNQSDYKDGTNVYAVKYCADLGEGWYLPVKRDIEQLFKCYNGTSFSDATEKVPAEITDAELICRNRFEGALESIGGDRLNMMGNNENGTTSWVCKEKAVDKAVYFRWGKRCYADGKKDGTSRTVRCVKTVVIE